MDCGKSWALKLTTLTNRPAYVEEFPWAKFPHKVAIRNACHSLRYLHHARPLN